MSVTNNLPWDSDSFYDVPRLFGSGVPLHWCAPAPAIGGHRSSPLLFSPAALLVHFEQQHEELVRQLLRGLVLLPQNLADLLLHLGIRLRSRGRRVVDVVCVVAMVKAHAGPRPCLPCMWGKRHSGGLVPSFFNVRSAAAGHQNAPVSCQFGGVSSHFGTHAMTSCRVPPPRAQ
jgi:hypothetical protein